MSRDWTEEELQNASKAMKAAGHLGYDEFCEQLNKTIFTAYCKDTDTGIKELIAEIIREFVEKIYVYKAERIDGRRVQCIKIIYNCIGELDSPVSTPAPEQEISA